jgi:DNA-directed RNA polymerase subunit RPC12/RpoP
MTDGKHCPACGKDVGVWPIVSAMLPNLIRCPHCRTRLVYRDAARAIVALLLVAAALGVGAFTALLRLPLPNLWERVAVVIVALLLLWLPIELWAAVYLRRTKRLDFPRQRGT